MLQNAYLLAKIGADTAENEQHFSEILPKTGNYPTGPGKSRLTSNASTVSQYLSTSLRSNLREALRDSGRDPRVESNRMPVWLSGIPTSSIVLILEDYWKTGILRFFICALHAL